MSTPALTPANEGLTVQWFYKGQDGVEHPWQNITGTMLAAGGYTIIARVERSALYEAAELTASFTVRKAAAPAIEWPTASGITYGQSVSQAQLSATVDSHGTFAWAQPDTVPNAGAQSAVLTYTPNDTANYDYSGVELTKQIAIAVSAKGLESGGISVVDIPDQTYTGGAIEPEIVVKDGDKTLVEGTDYEVTYENNVDAGTVTITGKGNYKSETSATFEIVPAEIPEIAWPEISSITCGQPLEEALSEMADEHGTFAWSSTGLVPNAGEHLFTLTYTPERRAELRLHRRGAGMRNDRDGGAERRKRADGGRHPRADLHRQGAYPGSDAARWRCGAHRGYGLYRNLRQ